MKADTLSNCAKAEMLFEEKGNQGTYRSQFYLDSAIRLCPNLAKAWREKGVPFLKRGDYATWLNCLNRAIEISPADFLDIRAWSKAKFLHDYKGALEDFKNFDLLRPENPKVIGDYNIYTWMALCESGLDHYKLALEYANKSIAISSKEHGEEWVGMYDFLYRGNIKLVLKDYKGALEDFDKQLRNSDKLAEGYYYKGLALLGQKRKKDAKKSFEKSVYYFVNGYTMLDPYVEMPFKVYINDAKIELAKLQLMD
ncbi:MAG: hypothetical protein LBV59_03155 [Sphingobacterium sp.]|uniref:tetratricopeptide repeat protein n=1 Tax=Sphingobacterium sp. TaxID=341027 RepID=UPI00284405B1|nr:hypothetical protein [Sphingobacterium sp.]MDR3006904.1 hypothetical protein [Sphingobacterium sp.]